ncbi:MAG TPA: type I DNA topoisomerase [Candidatus Kerfeldbacteria bacterium]|nr:type I DNA topoisomerase [Candidatus Kerfeldbacteria bacterium]
MKLVIVESPTKAKTIKRFLPDDFVVESSLGHIRDLPQSSSDIPAQHKKEKWARLGIDVEHDFKPLYIVHSEKKKHIATLKKLMKEADELYLATDEDREGEAISWHLLEVLQPTVPIKRLVFHEITKEAIQAAITAPREIDMHLVSAQETRRILDRLYGYEISPILWRKVAPKLSAGRVQSAALQLIVQREKARMAFHSAAYYDVSVQFTTADAANFSGKVVSVAGRKIASGKDFDSDGKTKTDVLVLDDATSTQLAKRIQGQRWTVTDIQQRPLTISAKPPFITSTLQQDAGRKFGWPAGKTMRTAQRLYEQGHITYMRTDSVLLSNEALQAARQKIITLYGESFAAPHPRQFKGKNKLAQEAHEAIRPAGTQMRTVEEIGHLPDDEARLYDLIWKRTVASQMADAKVLQTSIQLTYDDVTAQASGRTVQFAGFMKVYAESSDDMKNQEEALLPKLDNKQTVTAESATPDEHHTKPPARFTEASLIKEMESDGIGRPSTYATIMDTIQNRGYVYKQGNALVPRFVAFAVVALLGNNFPNLVNTDYTAAMEEDLDKIAAGQAESLPYLHQFYFGKNDQMGLHDMLKVEIDPRKTCTIPLGTDQHGHAVNVRVGRFGPFVEEVVPDGEHTASIPDTIAPDELTVEQALTFIEKRAAGPTALGTDPVSGEPVYVLDGRFGPYVQLGEKTTDKKKKPKMKGLLKGMQLTDVTLEIALQLLAFPKTLGEYPKTGEKIVADNGRFGPYIKAGVETRSLSPEDNLLSLTVDRAIAMLDTPKVRGRRTTVLKDLGNGIQICNGKYGSYLKSGKVNATIPKELSADTITPEQATAAIEQKRNK